MAPLGVRTKLARVHVLDHALAQRGDSLGCHRQLLSGMRLLAPPSSRQGASPATYDLAPGDNACRCARGRSLSRKRFSAMAHSRPRAYATACPQPAEADIRLLDGNYTDTRVCSARLLAMADGEVYRSRHGTILGV